eukprot:1160083-Pelagomonas_calceolata.AAC.1
MDQARQSGKSRWKNRTGGCGRGKPRWSEYEHWRSSHSSRVLQVRNDEVQVDLPKMCAVCGPQDLWASCHLTVAPLRGMER